MKKINIAIIGATGMVGEQMIQQLEERNVPVGKLGCYASEKSVGKKCIFQGKEHVVQALSEAFVNDGYDIALFAAGGRVSEYYAPLAARHGMIVIDNSSAFRMDPNVPLIVPEVNKHELHHHQGIIANPDCSTIQSVLPLHVIKKLFGIKRIVYSTYQAVSGSGMQGIHDLKATLEGEKPSFYQKPIAHNVIAQIDALLPDGNTKEEEKMIQETKKILQDDTMAISATCVRVPVFNGHCVAVHLTCETPIDLPLLQKTLKATKGIVYDETIAFYTPQDVSGQDSVHVCRLRKDSAVPNGLSFFVVADNIRKGAATNAIQILEALKEGE